jgi:hypothetical protein
MPLTWRVSTEAEIQAPLTTFEIARRLSAGYRRRLRLSNREDQHQKSPSSRTISKARRTAWAK